MQKLLPILACAISIPAFAASCESLASLAFPDTTITTAQVVAPGAFVPPGGPGKGKGANAYNDLPEFCRVAATLKPSSDSDIKVEFWLPTSNWNRKLQSVGNGGWAGVISYSALADAVKAGYAGASTDTGHVGGSGSFALQHPEQLIDFSWRSEHEMTLKAKASHPGVLWQRAESVVLERLFHRRPSGAERGAEIPRRLRRHHRRRACQSYGACVVGRFRGAQGSGQLHSRRQVPRDPPGRARRLRSPRRR